MGNDAYCKLCEKQFSSADALNMHNKSKHPVPVKKPLISAGRMKMARNIAILIAVAGVFGYIVFLTLNAPVYPPTSMQGHIEVNPPSHVMREPMQLDVQKHMLEHADGNGAPGTIINYNCTDFPCEAGLIEKLEAFAGRYNHVYVAPFPRMSAKIVLTKLDKIEILGQYDEATINSFIAGS